MQPTKRKALRKAKPHGFIGPQGAPRGFLRQYMLRRIADRPAHGYDILQEIASKTEGSWRPGPGSIYPILKELLAERYIRADSKSKVGTSQRVYHITPNGARLLQETSDTVLKAGRNWGAMRHIFIELIDPEQLPTLFTHMSAGQFGFVREIIESKRDKIPPKEIVYMLKEYAVNLQRQLDWTSRTLKQL